MGPNSDHCTRGPTAGLIHRLAAPLLSLTLALPALADPEIPPPPQAPRQRSELAAEFIQYLLITEDACPESIPEDTLNCFKLAKEIGIPRTVERYGPQYGRHPDFDQLQHCAISCAMTLGCANRFSVPVIYTSKEIRDLVDQFFPAFLRERDKGGKLKDGEFQEEDFLANIRGQILAFSFVKHGIGEQGLTSFEATLDRCAAECHAQWYPMTPTEPSQE